MKTCPDCKRELPKAFFAKNAKGVDGLYTYCRECAGVRKRAYRKYRQQEARDYQREYRKKNPERVRALKRASAARHAETNKRRVLKWVAENKERLAATKADYYKRTRSEQLARRKQRHELARDSLDPYYVAAMLVQGTRLKPRDVPKALIEAKSIQIKLLRQLKGVTDENR
jgi:hypothetical protein